MNEPALRCRGLCVMAAGSRSLLRDLDLDLEPGGSLLIVGTTGAGKSSLLLALAGLSPHRVTGELQVLGERRDLRGLAGGSAGVLLQDARGSFNPYLRVGPQLLEGSDRSSELQDRLEGLLDRLGLEPAATLRAHPHTLSDGMLRRAALAGALARRPQLILADEPTAGLDPPAAWVAWRLLLRSEAALVAVTHDASVPLRLAALDELPGPTLRRIEGGLLLPVEGN